MRFLLSGSKAGVISYAQPLLDEASIPSSQRGRQHKRYIWLLADKGYDAETLRRCCDQHRMQSVTPLRLMKRKPRPGFGDLIYCEPAENFDHQEGNKPVVSGCGII